VQPARMINTPNRHNSLAPSIPISLSGYTHLVAAESKSTQEGVSLFFQFIGLTDGVLEAWFAPPQTTLSEALSTMRCFPDHLTGQE
jgi:hypothetical protein